MELGITATDLTSDAIEVLTRPVYTSVPDQRADREAGWITAVRDSARNLVIVLGCATWTAATVEPAHAVRYVDQQWQEIYQLDDRFHIVHTIGRPAGRLDRWTITVNGQPIAHRARPGAPAQTKDGLTTSVWRHVQGHTGDECDALICANVPTTAVYGGGYCADHLHLYDQR